MGVTENYQRIAAQVAARAQECGREADAVRLIAVSKTVEAPVVELAVQGGANDFGENRPECLVEKAQAYPDSTWHFIGNVQSRRVKDIVAHASLIHSLYQERHARKINDEAAKIGKVQDVLIEVNVSGEESKGGCTLDQAQELAQLCLELPNVRLRGLMTMAPRADEQAERLTFSGLAELHGKLKAAMEPADAAVFDELSMGMSEDWPVAVEYGATMVRIGRAIFSDSF
ncbi:MAG: YggS family pyridoxal phosphate-dependent enzyme [Coriobacteriia bacterium]|nr:YggS family pyridoxal phosphate-dependent enzyme [Coriobacteriia bacterium]